MRRYGKDPAPFKRLDENGYPMNPSVVNYGSNNYDWGFEYKLTPLSTNLSQRGNDRKAAAAGSRDRKRAFYVGDEVRGESEKGGEERRGRIVGFEYSPDSKRKEVLRVWIEDSDTKERRALVPGTLKRVRKNSPAENGFFNLFATNYMHLHEAYDLFASGAGEADETEAYFRAACRRTYGISEETAALLDSSGFAARGYRAPGFRMTSAKASLAYPLIGVGDRTNASVRKTAWQEFLRRYYRATGRERTVGECDFDWKCSSGKITARDGSAGLPVASWRDLWAYFGAFRRENMSAWRSAPWYVPADVPCGDGRKIYADGPDSPGYRFLLVKNGLLILAASKLGKGDRLFDLLSEADYSGWTGEI